MKWLDEIFSRKDWSSREAVLADVGMLSIIHDHFNNDCTLSLREADELFAYGWRERIASLKSAGILEAKEAGEGFERRVTLKVIVKSDGRREQIKAAQERFRNKKDTTK